MSRRALRSSIWAERETTFSLREAISAAALDNVPRTTSTWSAISDSFDVAYVSVSRFFAIVRSSEAMVSSIACLY